MFSIEQFHKDGFDIIALKDDLNDIQVEIIPAHSAMLHAFRIPHGAEELNIIDGYSSLQDYQTNNAEYFKGAKLSPFACRIPDGRYEWEGKEYVIEKTIAPGSWIHGLLYDVAFEIVQLQANERNAVATLRYQYKGEDKGYPFPYDCEVTYSLQPDIRLQISTTISNRASTAIPLMDGWHPYFTTGTPMDDMELQFASEQIVEFNAQLIPTGKVLPYDRFLESSPLEGIPLDNSFLLNFDQHASSCTLRDPLKHIAITFYPDGSYPVLQLYIPPHRRSIAIENLTGPSNAFNNGMELIVLPAGESRTFSTGISAAAW
ncbi:aldose 1-epimerase [Chitinophaga pinensis]|uniref:Aldose 1-epimerase n=1 Tax=Chitinophaga pinensis (strain ATCC 43595 / DSM 2588 / LMG 13176 / NBRC 15968 / NCIMB 11800 / UQM 2034) TaxID=485918 RepID=A0A979G273_CHIPD|nr:aldose 1-epimerase [Chitinophaga pinensis]ACU59426.1 Aldose 1-epimerase [Chitinophaga pinensis DSM 2588]